MLQVEIRCHALDLFGIVGISYPIPHVYSTISHLCLSFLVLIVGSFYSSLHYGFFCEPRLKLAYLSAITAAGAGAAFIVLDPEYSKPTHRGARTAVFIFLGLSSAVPLAHALKTRDLVTLRVQMGLDYMILEGVLYIGGALL